MVTLKRSKTTLPPEFLRNKKRSPTPTYTAQVMGFAPNYAPNVDAYSGLHSGKTAGTLSLDNLTKEQFLSWMKKVETECAEKLGKIEKIKSDQNLHNIANLPWLWRPTTNRGSFSKISHDMGIPTCPEDFVAFQSSGIYFNTPVQDMTLTPKVVSDSGPSTHVKLEDPNVATSAAAKSKFTSYFFGGIPHDDESISFPAWFSTERAEKVRVAARTSGNIVIDKLPRQMTNMFLTNTFKNWSMVLDFIEGFCDFREDKPNLMRFISFVRFIQHPMLKKYVPFHLQSVTNIVPLSISCLWR